MQCKMSMKFMKIRRDGGDKVCQINGRKCWKKLLMWLEYFKKTKV